MNTIEGTAKQPGIAIAVAAVVDARRGINAVSPALLQEGISALMRAAKPADYPEAIIACDSLAVGTITRIPGISTAGIAAESDTDVPGIDIETPCVIGLTDLLRSISEGDILIVDGYRGEVHIDPDPQTVMHYQQAQERRNMREKVFITSEHIPARTQSGETVLVYAQLSKKGDRHLLDSCSEKVSVTFLETALEAGADGLLVDARGMADVGGVSGEILREAAGKPVVLVVDMHVMDVLRAAMAYCAPGQVTLVGDDSEHLASQVESAMDIIVLEALQLDIEAPDVKVGGIAHAGMCDPNDPSLIAIDAADCGIEDLPQMREERIVIIGGRLKAIEPLVKAGVRRIAVEPELVGDAKYAIRSIAPEG